MACEKRLGSYLYIQKENTSQMLQIRLSMPTGRKVLILREHPMEWWFILTFSFIQICRRGPQRVATSTGEVFSLFLCYPKCHICDTAMEACQ